MPGSNLPVCPECGEQTKQMVPKEIERLFPAWSAGELIDRECRCKQDKREVAMQQADQEAHTKRRIQALRERGIADDMCLSMRFENDKGYNSDVCTKARHYVANWPEMKAQNVGILFTGGVGTGKTFYAACIVNALLDRGIFALMTSLRRIIGTPFDQYENVLRNIEAAELVAFDDIGVERDTSFAWERAFDAIDARIRSEKPMIVTTNLSPEDLSLARDLREQRIYDRILGATVPVPVTGESIRMREQRQRVETLASFLK